jgi:hypothetical protein
MHFFNGPRANALPSPSRQVIWTFSIYLEAVAILPQLVLLQRTQNIDNLTGNYVFLLGWVPRIGPLRALG